VHRGVRTRETTVRSDKFEIYFYPNGAVLLAPAACSGSRSRTTTRCHPRERAATRAGHIVTIAGTYTI